MKLCIERSLEFNISYSIPGMPKSQESENSGDNQPGTSFAAAVITSGIA